MENKSFEIVQGMIGILWRLKGDGGPIELARDPPDNATAQHP